MGKAPEKPNELFQPVTADYARIFADDLVSIVLYGSAASSDYQPGRSDINLMIVLTEQGIDHLEQALPLVEKWRKKQVAVPLFLTPHYVRSSVDVFPLEYLDLQHRHVLVHGRDILSDLSFDPEHIRLQCEREIKGKLLLLREAFLRAGGKKRELVEVISSSLQSFMAIFKGLLFLKNQDLPDSNREIISAACTSCHLKGDLFLHLLDVRQGRSRPDEAQTRKLFLDYLKEVKSLSTHVDQEETAA